MAANVEDQLIAKVRALPPDKQQEALRLLDTLTSGASSQRTDVDRKPLWEVIDEINAGLPADTWENVPTDSSVHRRQHWVREFYDLNPCILSSNIRIEQLSLFA